MSSYAGDPRRQQPDFVEFARQHPLPLGAAYDLSGFLPTYDEARPLAGLLPGIIEWLKTDPWMVVLHDRLLVGGLQSPELSDQVVGHIIRELNRLGIPTSQLSPPQVTDLVYWTIGLATGVLAGRYGL